MTGFRSHNLSARGAFGSCCPRVFSGLRTKCGHINTGACRKVQIILHTCIYTYIAYMCVCTCICKCTCVYYSSTYPFIVECMGSLYLQSHLPSQGPWFLTATVPPSSLCSFYLFGFVFVLLFLFFFFPLRSF